MEELTEVVGGKTQFSQYYIKKRGWSPAQRVDVGKGFYFNNEELKEYTNDIGLHQTSDAMSIWLRENCEGRFDRCGLFSIDFELESDAVLFKLYWCP